MNPFFQPQLRVAGSYLHVRAFSVRLGIRICWQVAERTSKTAARMHSTVTPNDSQNSLHHKNMMLLSLQGVATRVIEPFQLPPKARSRTFTDTQDDIFSLRCLHASFWDPLLLHKMIGNLNIQRPHMSCPGRWSSSLKCWYFKICVHVVDIRYMFVQ